MADRVTLKIAEIEALAARALTRAGTSPVAAQSLAKAIAAAEGDGLSSHGLAYLATYCEHVGLGKVAGNAVPKVETPAPGVVVVDAGMGFAHPAIDAGFAALMPRARSQGIAQLSIRNSYNCGVLGYHTERLAAQGFVALGFTNAPASIAPSGGKKPILGTNPWALAVPDGRGGAAIAIDQSSSAVAKSEVIKKSRSGEPIPLGWALDPDGKPTTDAALGLKGSMVPSGGYKGVGSAILVEIMAAALSGATLGIHASPFSGPAGGPPKTGQCFIAINPETSSGGAFAERVAALAAAFHDQPGAHLPGAGRSAARKKSATAGAAIDRAIYDTVVKLAG
jgi:(2R)-3-sulfolactate dehydrogenase (NADP+)